MTEWPTEVKERASEVEKQDESAIEVEMSKAIRPGWRNVSNDERMKETRVETVMDEEKN